MILTFTDFGVSGPYVGQMAAVIARDAPGVPVIDLMADAPAFDPQASAYLLAALWPQVPAGAVCLAVVDPGVGTARRAIYVETRDSQGAAAPRWLVGPDNGLLAVVAATAAEAAEVHEILWRPPALSASFHGRDLFAPVAARLATGRPVEARPLACTDLVGADWPASRAAVIYIDGYGNAMTGLRAAGLGQGDRLAVGDFELAFAPTFAEVPAASAFWYANSLGLVEIAVNRGSAAAQLGLGIGTPVRVTGG